MSTGNAPALHQLKNPPLANRLADLFASATVVLFAGCGGTTRAAGGRTVDSPAGEVRLGKPQQRTLDALAWWASIGVRDVDRVRLGAVAGISPSGGYLDNLLKPLSALGIIERRGGQIFSISLVFPEGLR